jgi:hypothetical protein
VKIRNEEGAGLAILRAGTVRFLGSVSHVRRR